MGGRVICFASAKGGSGKTSLIATFATFLSRLGKKTLLIDSDFATNGLTLLYLKEVKVGSELIHAESRRPVGLCDALQYSRHPDAVTISETLQLVPAAYTLNSDVSLSNDSARKSFQEIIASLRSSYDFIFIDAQAGADDLGQIAMSRRVSDEVVLVSEYDPMSAAGVERLKAILREDLTYDRTWVLLNKLLPEFAKSFSDFMEVAKYLSPIPWDASVVRAYARRQLAVDTDSGNEHTIAVLRAVKTLCGDEIGDELGAWVQSRAAAIRQPIEEQYADAEKELATLLSERAERHKLDFSFRVIRASVAALISFVGIIIFWLVFRDDLKHYLGDYGSFEPVISALGTISFIIVFSFLINIDVLKKFIGTNGVRRQIDDLRYDRQLELLRDRLRRLELLRTLDAESLLGKYGADFRGKSRDKPSS